MRGCRRLDRGDTRPHLPEPFGQCPGVFGLGEQRQIRDTHEKGVRYRVRFRNERERRAAGRLPPLRGGMEDTPALRGGGSFGRVHETAFLQLGEQVVDRGEPDLGPLPYPAALDHLFQVVAVLRGLDEQTEDDEFGRRELHRTILALE